MANFTLILKRIWVFFCHVIWVYFVLNHTPAVRLGAVFAALHRTAYPVLQTGYRFACVDRQAMADGLFSGIACCGVRKTRYVQIPAMV